MTPTSPTIVSAVPSARDQRRQTILHPHPHRRRQVDDRKSTLRPRSRRHKRPHARQFLNPPRQCIRREPASISATATLAMPASARANEIALPTPPPLPRRSRAARKSAGHPPATRARNPAHPACRLPQPPSGEWAHQVRGSNLPRTRRPATPHIKGQRPTYAESSRITPTYCPPPATVSEPNELRRMHMKRHADRVDLVVSKQCTPQHKDERTCAVPGSPTVPRIPRRPINDPRQRLP